MLSLKHCECQLFQRRRSVDSVLKIKFLHFPPRVPRQSLVAHHPVELQRHKSDAAKTFSPQLRFNDDSWTSQEALKKLASSCENGSLNFAFNIKFEVKNRVD